jgi:hypothetical protein
MTIESILDDAMKIDFIKAKIETMLEDVPKSREDKWSDSEAYDDGHEDGYNACLSYLLERINRL